MPDLSEKSIPLYALSARQRRLVERHLPLVQLTLGRMDLFTQPFRSGRERCDLLQEGCLALAEAVRSHDPVAHGAFAAFAMSRVRYAISRYRHERESLIRVPFTTQRRRLARSRESRNADRHHPDPIAKVVPRGDLSTRAGRRRVQCLTLGQNGVSIADRIGERYARALARALSSIKHSPRSSGPAQGLLDRFRDERWTIPEPAARTPLRTLARELNCSLGTTTRCENRVRRKVAALLRRDRIYRALRRLAQTKPAAWGQQLTPAEWAELQTPDSTHGSRAKQGPSVP